jgi:hypothetical protein
VYQFFRSSFAWTVIIVRIRIVLLFETESHRIEIGKVFSPTVGLRFSPILAAPILVSVKTKAPCMANRRVEFAV